MVEPIERLGLGGLDHERLLDDEREVDGGCVHAEIEQALGDVEGLHAVLAQAPAREHELVHAVRFVREVVARHQAPHQVVGVQDRGAAHAREP